MRSEKQNLVTRRFGIRTRSWPDKTHRTATKDNSGVGTKGDTHVFPALRHDTLEDGRNTKTRCLGNRVAGEHTTHEEFQTVGDVAKTQSNNSVLERKVVLRNVCAALSNYSKRQELK